MKKNLLISLIIVLLAVAIGLSVKFNLHTKLYEAFNKPVRQELPEIQNAKSYSINAVINSISGNTLKVSVNRLFVGPEGNYIATENKTVKVSNTTLIQFTSISDGKFIKTPASLSDLTTGTSVVLYSTKDIARLDTIIPDRVDIPKK